MFQLMVRPNSILVAILVVAACLRLYRLDEIPPGFQFDQAHYIFDALFLLRGDFHIFFREPGRSEPLFQYLLIPWVALFGGDTPLGAKVTASIIGIATIFPIYGIARALFGSTRLALLTALFTAISFWHIFYCRYGERIPLTLFFATLSFWFFWRAVQVPSSKFQVSGSASRLSPLVWRDYILTGLFAGLTLYTYPSGRIVPIALVLLTIYAALADRARAAHYARGLVIAGLVATTVFLPLGIYYLQHPLDFFSHTAEVSIFTPHGEISDHIPLELSKNALKILGMFFIVGDAGVLRNLPYRPVFDPFVGALFVVGAIIWFAELIARRTPRVTRLRAVFLAVWLGLALALSLVSDDAPNNGRILIGLPVVMMLPAWGALTIWARLRAPLARRVATTALGTLVAISTTLVARDIFVVWANDPGTYYAFDVDKVELAQWINQHAPTHHLYLAPVTHQVGTVSLLTRRAPLKSFDSRDTIVLPSRAADKDALYIFPPEQEKRVQTLAMRLGTLGTRETVIGSNGAPLALLYRVPASNLPNPQAPISNLQSGGDFVKPQNITRAVWDDAIELWGYSIDAADAAKRNLEVTLFLRALAPLTEDYTFSIKARDAQERAWGQEDKQTGSNSYPTRAWSVGDVIIERFYAGLNACAPAGEYRVTVEVYDPKTMRVLAPSDREENAVELGKMRAETSPGNLYEHLEPARMSNVRAGERLQLFGYTLAPEPVRAGEAFSLALFWRGVGTGAQEHITIRLRDIERDFVLAEKDVTLPREGRGACAFFDLRMPREVIAGEASLQLNQIQFATIQVVE